MVIVLKTTKLFFSFLSSSSSSSRRRRRGGGRGCLLRQLLHHHRVRRHPTSLPSCLLNYCTSRPKEEEDDDDCAREQELIGLFASCTTMRELTQIHARLIRTGFDQHVYVVGRLISFCCVSPLASLHYATSVFDQLAWPDAFIWNTIIRGLARAGRAADAFSFYRRMRERGKPADNFTFTFLLGACGQTSSAEMGRTMHCCLLKHGLGSHVFVANALIHMYGLFGDLVNANQVFDELPLRDLVSWNTLITALAHSGLHKEALELFRRMKTNSGLAPDEATLVVVLSACSELGELGWGRWVHSAMNRRVLEKSVAVANSLIDMYAKCGDIERARKVFDDLKEGKNVVSWNSMILGLAMHGHAEEAIALFEDMRELELTEPNDITLLGVLCACSHGGLVEQGKSYFESMQREYNISPNIRHYGCMVDMFGRAGLIEEAYEMITSLPTAAAESNAVLWRTLLGACREQGHVELGERVRKHLEELEPDHSSDFVLLSQIYAKAGRWHGASEVRQWMDTRGARKPAPGNSLLT